VEAWAVISTLLFLLSFERIVWVEGAEEVAVKVFDGCWIIDVVVVVVAFDINSFLYYVNNTNNSP
jgi:hypothetical protein